MTYNKQYFKILADAAIPLLGYFLWDWGIYFIFLFYSLDLITREVIIHFKARKIDRHQNSLEQSQILKYVLLSILSLLTILFLMHIIAMLIKPEIDFRKEMISFLTYSEMGIQQGYLLIPLVAFAGFADYKSDFLIPQKFLKLSKNELWSAHLRSSLFLIVLGLVLVALTFFLQEIELLVLLILVLSLILFQLRALRIKN